MIYSKLLEFIENLQCVFCYRKSLKYENKKHAGECDIYKCKQCAIIYKLYNSTFLGESYNIHIGNNIIEYLGRNSDTLVFYLRGGNFQLPIFDFSTWSKEKLLAKINLYCKFK